MKWDWIDVFATGIIFGVLLIILLMVLLGCSASSITYALPDSNTPYTFTGAAADRVAEKMAMNALTAQGRRNEMQKYNPYLYAGFVLCGVAGGAFWFLTRSSKGWIIPASAVSGVVFITFWSEYSQWVALGVLVIVLVLLVWKAREYQKERNWAGR